MPRKPQEQVEQYEHTDKRRLNNPPVGLVTPTTDPDGKRVAYAFDPHLDPELRFDGTAVAAELDQLLQVGLAAESLDEARDALEKLRAMRNPYLTWAGKAERTGFEVPTVSLHVHERIDSRTLVDAIRMPVAEAPTQMGLFEAPEENPPLREAVDFYRHPHRWSNRIVAGDSLLVMNSLLEKEGMAGKVQMVYMDPPYGIEYGSNFQPFVKKSEVKDRKDEHLTSEPETLKAFRDMWELDIHSYLSYLRDRLWLAKDLLASTGSVFVQISDKNVHIVRNLLDEVFGVDNFVSLISFATTSGFQSKELARAGDYLLWYARDKNEVKVRKLWVDADRDPTTSTYKWLMLPDGTYRGIKAKERRGEEPLPEGARVYKPDNIKSQGGAGEAQPFEHLGKTYLPGAGNHWKANYPDGMNRLAVAGRIHVARNSIQYVRYADDFPYQALNNMWTDTGTGNFTDDKIFVVQTNTKVIQRCVLMTTDPGDIVLDPTCGSGTTAYVAEEWGRRWITIDSSRVAVTLAKQRLMTAAFDYYELAHPDEGVASGFVYDTAPHVTLESIANNPEVVEGMDPETIDAVIAKYALSEALYDRPHVTPNVTRVTGPFTVEAVPAPIVAPISDLPMEPAGDDSVAREGETLRQGEWRGELLSSGVRAKGGQRLRFATVEPLGGARYLHADAVVSTNGDAGALDGARVVVSFGPEHTLLEQRQVELAWEEAQRLSPRPSVLLFVAFEFDPEAAKDIDSMDAAKAGMTFLKAEMNMDLATADLKRKRSSSESFWLIGQPEVEVVPSEVPDEFVVAVHGFDYFNTKTATIDSGGPEKIAMWMLDPDYDGRSLYPRQVFLPLADDDAGWTKLAKTLKASVDPDRAAALASTRSLPFRAGSYRRIAVKLVDDRGIESLVVRDLP
ncbi:MAG: site-specific DNA-methyltransferase [Acidimicrobiales bacterium]